MLKSVFGYPSAYLNMHAMFVSALTAEEEHILSLTHQNTDNMAAAASFSHGEVCKEHVALFRELLQR